MKPAPFEYVVAESAREAAQVLGDHPGARVIAGGQSLMPLLNLRMARPELLIDISRVEALKSLEINETEIRIGAAVTQSELEAHEALTAALPIVPQTVRQIGHLPIRTRSTVGGSLVHADPAAEWPALALLLDGRFVLESDGGCREVDADSFFLGPFWTEIAPSEVLVEVRLPNVEWSGSAAVEYARRTGDFCLAGVLAVLKIQGEKVANSRLVAFGVGSVPLRLFEAEAALVGLDMNHEFARAMTELPLPEESLFVEDIHASPTFRRWLLRNALNSALTEAAKRGERSASR